MTTVPAGIAVPTYEQVGELPVSLNGRVTPDLIDENGHMNLRHYLSFAARAADRMSREVGVDDDYRASRGLGVFTAEHHLRYLSELREGEELSVRTRVLDVGEKALHVMAFVLDETSRRLAFTMEALILTVDLERRRAAATPADVVAGWTRLLDAAAGLDWPAPVCGSIGVRR
jgi:acyl-CoA thioester hydrolase